jgi:DNA (cytosine-5)-methyltransferase 1
MKPGEKDEISKTVRLKADGLCPTLRAGTDASRGSYQAVRPVRPTAARVITPREAARLQGFPDWFQFAPTKWHSFRQIGNSVSPFVAEAVLAVLADSLRIASIK